MMLGVSGFPRKTPTSGSTVYRGYIDVWNKHLFIHVEIILDSGTLRTVTKEFNELVKYIIILLGE